MGNLTTYNIPNKILTFKKPSVTELINLLDKPALLNWANRIGLEGIALKDYRKKSANDGKEIHKAIENDLKFGIKYNNEKFQLFKSKYEIVKVEPEIECEHYTGRADVLLNDKFGLSHVFDFKNSNKVYFEQIIQIVAYKKVLKPDRIGIVNIDTFEEIIIELSPFQERQYLNILGALTIIYKSKKELNL